MTPRLLFIGDGGPFATSTCRAEAFRRLGLDVFHLDTAPYAAAGGRWAAALRIRLLHDPVTMRFNRDVVARSRAFDPHVVWFDKPSFLQPRTVEVLRRQGPLLVCHIQDNPFHTLPGEPGWRLIRRCLPLFDVNVVPRRSSIADYAAAGAAEARLMWFAFDPWVNHPPRGGRLPPPDLPLCFIGSPYDQRPRILETVAGGGRRIAVFGNRWAGRLTPSERIRLEGPVFREAYRATIQAALACLGFVTHGHRDENAHRAFEVTGSGGVLLAERTPAHQEIFAEDRESLFFSSPGEILDKAGFLDRHPAARTAIAAAGMHRAWTGGHTNDERQAALLGSLDRSLFGHLPAVARAVVAARRTALGLDP